MESKPMQMTRSILIIYVAIEKNTHKKNKKQTKASHQIFTKI